MIQKTNRISQEEINRMERELISMEMELNDYYRDAGKTILEQVEQQERKINNLVERIIEVRRKLVDAKNEKYCSACEEHNERNSRYCKYCGRKFENNEKITRYTTWKRILGLPSRMLLVKMKLRKA